ncbi:MAG: hypothetical protein AAF604_15515 [Acidobacteriota bacterium]
MNRLFGFGLSACIVFSLSIDAQPPQLAEIAASLPPLERTVEGVILPTDGTEPFRWHDIAEGVEATSKDQNLEVSFAIQPGQAAGASLIVPAGTLEGLDHLAVTTHASRTSTLQITLQDGDGLVYAFPPFQVRIGKGRTSRLAFEELSHFPHQTEVPDSGSFEPADAVMLTVVDLSGFLGGAAGDITWTIERLAGVAP